MKKLININKQLLLKGILLSFCDAAAALGALTLALVLRLNSLDISAYNGDIMPFWLAYSAVVIIIYSIFGLYKSLWKFASVEEMVKLLFASASAATILFLINLRFGHNLPNSVPIIAFFVQAGLSGTARFSYRVLRLLRSKFKGNGKNDGGQHRTVVIGSGYEAVATIKSFAEGKRKGTVVALIDRRHCKGTRISGIEVRGGLDELENVIRDTGANEVVIASERFTEEDIAKTLDICARSSCRLRKYQAVSDLGESNRIVDIDPRDLLGRPQVELDQKALHEFLTGKTVLVTGGGGSIGSELVRQMAAYNPKKIIMFDIFENTAYLTKLAIERKHPGTEIDVEIGSIRDFARLGDIFEKHKPEVVFHAAAHKHVPLMEKSPAEALKNNVIGTYNTAVCADAHGVEKFVLISTDKAVNPTSVMGASKRLAEIVVKAMDAVSKTEFSAVRFGNVLGSSGSVIPIFRQQIEEGGPVLVTHPEIRRFFMTIPEAAQLVLQAGALSKGGEIFVLDMHKPIRIRELAEKMIKMYGYIPDVDIKIEYTGLRPGEKLFEEPLIDASSAETRHEKIFVEKSRDYSLPEIEGYLDEVRRTAEGNGGIEKIASIIRVFVPEYQGADIARINGEMYDLLN